MKTKVKIISFLLALFIICSVVIIPASATASVIASMPFYVAFGDSISRGYGLTDIPSQAFPYLLANRLGYAISNYAVDGYTAEDIYNLIKDGQFDDDIQNADLITITCGGNDLMATLYTHIAAEYNAVNDPDITPKEVLVALDGKHPTISQASILLYATDILSNFTSQDSFKNGLVTYTEYLTKLMQYIRAINPTAQVIIPTQYSPYEIFRSNFLFKLIYQETEKGVVELNKVIKAQAEILNYTVSDVYTAFKSKAPTNLCNANASNFLSPNLDFHPNKSGHKVLADTVYATCTHIHAYKIAWDATHHYKVCECGNITEKQPHSSTPADCQTPAVCDVCSQAYAEIDPENHTAPTELRNQKDATEFEDGYSGDTYCTGCDELLLRGEIISATHQHDYKLPQQLNDTHHLLACSCGETQEQAHSGGSADCQNKAICEICEDDYGELNSEAHIGETEIRNEKAAEEFEEGYTGDTYCSGCNTVLKYGESIPATHQHSYQTPQKLNNTHHALACSCGDTQEQPHSGGDADCSNKAICDICDTAYGVLNSKLHTGETELRNEKAAAEFEEGYTGDTHCSGCGALLSKGKTIPATHKHNYVTPQPLNETHHVLACSCGDKQEQLHSGGTATCRDEAVCDACQTPYGGKTTEQHIGTTEVRNAKEATEFEEGYTGDTHCTGCGTVLEQGQTIPPTHQHVLNQYEKLNDTNHKLRCSCGLQQEEAHTFNEQQICSRCGFEVESKQPEPQPPQPVPQEPTSSSATIWIIFGGVAAITAIIVVIVVLQRKKKIN